MANIRKHELISQLFLLLDFLLQFEFRLAKPCHPVRRPNRTAVTPIVSRTSEIGRHVPKTPFLRYQRAQLAHRRERPANSKTACGTSARNAHSRESRKRRRSH